MILNGEFLILDLSLQGFDGCNNVGIRHGTSQWKHQWYANLHKKRLATGISLFERVWAPEYSEEGEIREEGEQEGEDSKLIIHCIKTW